LWKGRRDREVIRREGGEMEGSLGDGRIVKEAPEYCGRRRERDCVRGLRESFCVKKMIEDYKIAEEISLGSRIYNPPDGMRMMDVELVSCSCQQC
jgi:hypothetical protein